MPTWKLSSSQRATIRECSRDDAACERLLALFEELSLPDDDGPMPIEAELHEVLQLNQAILDCVNYSIISTTPDGIIRTFNAAAQRMLGYTAEEVIGRITPEQFHDREEVVRRARELSAELGEPIEPGFRVFVEKARRGLSDEQEWIHVRKDGSHLQVLLSVTSLRDARGQLTGFIGLASDITERQEIDRLKREFISVVSHELRTPLTSIHGSLGLLAGGVTGELPPLARSMIDIAWRNSERLIRLINDILDMEKIESGRMVFHPRPVRLRAALEQAIEANRGFAEQLGVTLELPPTVPEGHVLADPDRLQQVLANLLSNASKFSPSGESVQVTATRQSDMLRVSITDRGPGIPEAFRDRIFQKFAQADASDSRQKGGTGLGLSISKAIVERLGGRIDFTSEVGRGTTFTLDLPGWPHPERVAAPGSHRAPEGAPGLSRWLAHLLEQSGESE